MDPMDINRVTGKYCEQLYTHKSDNLDKINQFLEKKKLPNLIKEKIENLNRSVSVKGIQ